MEKRKQMQAAGAAGSPGAALKTKGQESMKTRIHLLPLERPGGERWRKAFTIVELTAIVAMFVLLAVVGASAISGTRYRTRIALCAAHLRQFTMAIEIYGNENGGRLPSSSTGYWAWDLPWGVADLLMGYGAQRNNMYCPANPGQNVERLWNFAPDYYRVIGYALTLPGISSLNSTNLNPSVVPQSIPYGPIRMPPPLPARRVLLADATISSPGGGIDANRTLYNYVNIVGGYYLHHRTSHLDGLLPAGGNLGMLDGHVEWREFPDMHVRSLSGAALTWWW